MEESSAELEDMRQRLEALLRGQAEVMSLMTSYHNDVMAVLGRGAPRALGSGGDLDEV